MSSLSKKRGPHDLRILRFERTASTAAVHTRGNFEIVPSPYDIDGERKTSVNIAIKTDKLNTGYEYQNVNWIALQEKRVSHLGAKLSCFMTEKVV